MVEDISLHERKDKIRTLNVSQFEGFTEERRNWLKMAMERSGLPLDNIDVVIAESSSFFDKIRSKLKRPVGHAYYELGNGVLVVKSVMENDHHLRQVGAIVHELAHANDPFHARWGQAEWENNTVYGGKENRAAVAEHVMTIADQSLKTGVYLNGYHKRLAKEVKNGKKDIGIFYIETHAIMIELYFMNINHLRQVEKSQKKKLEKKGIEFKSILTEKKTNVPEGVEKTLIYLMPEEIRTVADLRKHVSRFRKLFR